MASIEGHYRGPLDHDDATAIAEHLRRGGRRVLPSASRGDYGSENAGSQP